VKPAAFDYHRVDRVEDAVARLAELGEDAKVLAGGQSLVPMMNFRLVRPPALVDITRIPDLRYIGRDGDVLRIGALTLHREIEMLDWLIHGCYRAFHHFELFASYVMYYFAAAITCETRRRSGVASGANDFLLSHDPIFRPRLKEAYEVLLDLTQSPHVSPAATHACAAVSSPPT